MSLMFNQATSFNQNIGGWDVSSAINMFAMFETATSFNQNIGAWDTSNVFTMQRMFDGASVFNQDIGNWDTSKVENMGGMFENATNFNQDLSGWCVGYFQSEPTGFATGSALTTGNKPVWGTCPSFVANGSITYIGEATGTTSATLPAHQAGDLILAFAFRDGSTTLPTQPTGWTSIDTAAANTCSARFAYKVAVSGSETTGTWTSASTTIFLVYRGVDTTALGDFDTVLATESTGSSTTVTYNANGFWQGLSRIVALAGHRSVDTALGTAPGTLSLIVNPVDATDEAAAFQSTVDNFGNWTSTNVSVGGTASGWITFVMRLRVPIVPV
jgi:surface protein